MSFFQDRANAQGHLGYAKGSEETIFQHTTGKDISQQSVSGYMKFLSKIIKFTFPQKNNCIDIGCGAGFIASEFKSKSLNIKGLEYSYDALNIAKKYNPTLEVIQGDMSYPHCMDYNLMIKTFRKDKRLAFVSDKYYEIIFNKFSKLIFGKISYKFIELLLKPLIFYKKMYENWASIYIIVFVKK